MVTTLVPIVNLFQPAFATWDLHSAEADSSILRAFSPEARLVVKAPGEEVQPSSIDYDSPNATDSPAKGVLCHQIVMMLACLIECRRPKAKSRDVSP